MASRLLMVVVSALPAYAYFYNVGSIGFWLPLYAREAGWGYTEIALLATIYFLAVIVATPAAGLVSDATRRPGLVLSAGMAVVAATSFLMPSFSDPAVVLALRGLQGAGLAVGLPIALGSLSLLEGVRRGVGITALFSGLGMASAAALSGALVEWVGFPPLFYASGLVALASTLAPLVWPPPPPPEGLGVLEALRRVPREVAVAMAGIAVRNFFASGVFSVIAIIFNKIVGVSYLATGLALAVNPAVQGAASVALSRVLRGFAVIAYSAGLSGTAIPFAIYLMADGLPDLVAAQALLGVFYASTVVSGNIIIVSLSPPEIRYTASSFYGTAFNLGWVFGTLVAGPVMDAGGVRLWLSIAIAGVAASGLLPLALLRSPKARRI